MLEHDDVPGARQFDPLQFGAEPSLVAGFLLDDLAVAFLQSLALAALLLDSLWLAGSASGATVPAPVQEELIVLELAVFENAHAAGPKVSAAAVCRTMGMKPW